MLLGSAMFVSPAFSQSGGTPPPAGGQGGKGGDLGGPPVGPGAHEGDGDFGGEGRPGKGAKGGAMGQRMQSGRAWMMTFSEMKASLTDDQRAKAEQIEKDFRVKEEAWRKENGKMKALAEAARNSGGAPDPQTMQQMKALNDSRPKLDEVQKQIFGMLTPEQQETFKKNLAANEAKLKEQAAKRGGRPRWRGRRRQGWQGQGRQGQGWQGRRQADRWRWQPAAAADGSVIRR
ncbi:MAG: hypothetical protein EBR71_10400 [Planctomycetes bacterium]|nr:hypothetical protein [Planctomycetota bacterium]